MTTQPHLMQRPPQSDYSGRRHARITKSMKDLPRAVLQILTELRYSIADGETQAISNATVAHRTGLSEGFVSAAVRWLAGEAIPYVPQLAHPPRYVFIERRLRQGGQPGYEITMLMPPELRSRSGTCSFKARANTSPATPPDTAAQCAEPLFLGDHHRDPLLPNEHTAPECPKTAHHGDHWHDPPIFCIQTENESTNHDPPPNHVGAGGGALPACEETPPAPPADTPTAPPALQTVPPACDRNHQGDEALAPELIAGHQALNPERAIFPGEWYELLALQATHGTEKLLTWQARAARRAEGQPTRILPGYYRACAAHAAIDNYRPRRHDSPPPEPVPASSPPPVPLPTLDPVCDALLRELGIRECQQLAHVPLALIEQWAAVIDHAGLAARFDDPRAFAHAQLRRGNAPPSRAELERWAERARSRAASVPAPALTDEQLAAIQARAGAIESRAAEIAPPDITCNEHVALLADLEHGLSDSEALERLHAGRAATTAPEPTPEQICARLLEELKAPLHRRHWPLIQRIRLECADAELRIVCTQVADLGTVEAEIAPHIRAALRSYAWQPSVRVVAQAPPVAPPPSAPQPPTWIRAERWERLPGLLKTMLLGSVLEEGSLRCASPSLSRQAHARYGETLVVLLAERRQEADDAIV